MSDIELKTHATGSEPKPQHEAQANLYAKLSGRERVAGDLELRLTHGYVGTCAHLDDWSMIGRYTIEASRTEADEVDPGDDGMLDHCEPETTTAFLTVSDLSDGVEDNDIKKALADVFTKHDCAHEYDCCGCRSFYAEAEHVGGPCWLVVIHSSRNF